MAAEVEEEVLGDVAELGSDGAIDEIDEEEILAPAAEDSGEKPSESGRGRDEDDEEEAEEASKSPRAKFAKERITAPPPDATNATNGKAKVLLNPNYKGSVKAQPNMALRLRPGVVHLGVVNLSQPARPPNVGHIGLHPPRLPPPHPHQPPLPHMAYPQPHPPRPRPTPLIPANPRDWLVKPGEPPKPDSDWLRMTEEFLNKGKGAKESNNNKGGSPSTSPSPSPNRSRGEETAEREKSAVELGLGQEYLRKLAEQRRLAEEYKRTKEAKRAAELRQKQRERKPSRGGDEKEKERRRKSSPQHTRHQSSPSPQRKRASKHLSRSPSPLAKAAKSEGGSRTIRLPIHQRPEFTAERGESGGGRGNSSSARRRQSSPERRRRRRSSQRSRSPRRSLTPRRGRHRRHRRGSSSSSSSRSPTPSSSSSSSSSATPPPPQSHNAHMAPSQPYALPGQPLHYGAQAPMQAQPSLNPAAPPFYPRHPGPAVYAPPPPHAQPQPQPVIQMMGVERMPLTRPGAPPHTQHPSTLPPQPQPQPQPMPQPLPQPHFHHQQPPPPPHHHHLHQQQLHLPSQPQPQLQPQLPPPRHMPPQPFPPQHLAGPQQLPPQPLPQPQGLIKTTPIRPLSLAERLGGGAMGMGAMGMGGGMGVGVGGGVGVVGPRPIPGAMIAVVKGLAPATTPERLRMIASTIAPVSLVLPLSPGVALLQFANPADAGRYAQNYNGRKLDNAVLNISIETAR